MKKISILSYFLFLIPYFAYSQNVGIGVTAPAEKLHVAGNIKADTIKPNALKLIPNAGTGKILTSDAAGNANWQVNNSAAAGNTGFGVWGDCATNGNISEYNPVVDTAAAANDNFGKTVSISGNYAIVGGLLDDVGANTDQGSASIYQYTGNGWQFMQKITDATGAANDNFGYSVSISGNYAIVGAGADDVGANADQGSVSIYQYNGSNWVLMQKITDAAGAGGDFFGTSVSISGDKAIVGELGDDVTNSINQGSVLFYKYNGSSWVLMEKISDGNGVPGDLFGNSVFMSGNYAIVGAYQGDIGANTEQGWANVYQYDGSNWVWMQRLTDANGAASDFFGYSVSISSNYAIVGAFGDDFGANSLQGSASIYKYNGSSWVLMQKITDPAGTANDFFGRTVSISGNYAVIGASQDDVGINVDQGSASIYQRIGLRWVKLQYITDPAGASNDQFGDAAAIDETTKRFLIGDYNYAGGSGKVVFGKIN
jgi:hypothetical protein